MRWPADCVWIHDVVLLDGPIKPVVIVLDNGPIHVSKAATAALAARAYWLAVEWLSNYAPEAQPTWSPSGAISKPIIWPPDLHRRRQYRPGHSHRSCHLEH
jgi:transposase